MNTTKRNRAVHFLKIFTTLVILSLSITMHAQFPPPAGVPGTTAMFRDSAAFISWASECSIERGYIDFTDTTLTYNGINKATYGNYLHGSGPADELVVSLGDRGVAILEFDIPIVNRKGFDFAVFENSFSNSFLELAFVEVSSDGKRFVRFPAISLTQDTIQVGTFDTIDTRHIYNMAGKYRLGFGTPFDLDDVVDSSGLNTGRITHIRIIDAGGCIKNEFSVFDSQGNKINDPWPTPFDTGGFDFDAVGVIHNMTDGLPDGNEPFPVVLAPNPVTGSTRFLSNEPGKTEFSIISTTGNILLDGSFCNTTTIDLSFLQPGIYFARTTNHSKTSVIRFCKL